ncbi:MAG: hypothetical protein AAF532_13200 [Planctomycetota bacterium]
MRKRDRRQPRLTARAFVTALAALLAAPAPAGVVLDDGFRIEGADYEVDALTRGQRGSKGPMPYHPIIAVDDGIRRVFVPKSRVAARLGRPQIAAADVFQLPGPPAAASGGRLASLGPVKVLEPFDAFGRRTVQIDIGRGPTPVVQGVTDMTPDAVVIRANRPDWKFGLATAMLPPDTLLALLRTASDEKKLGDRLAVVSFLVRADQHLAARAELDAVRRDFPDDDDRIGPLAAEVDRFQAVKIVNELRRRRRAGQPRLAAAAAARFPRDLAEPAVVDEFDRLAAEIADDDARVDRIHRRLREDVAELRRDPAGFPPATGLDAAAFADAADAVADHVTHAAVDRLAPYERFAAGPSAASRLAWALSGWAAGPTDATDDATRAANLWAARTLLADAVAAESGDVSDAVRRLDALEGIGPDEVAVILPLLDPSRPNAARPGEPHTVTAPDGVRYDVVLPPEYDPLRGYPAVVSLHPEGLAPADAAAWWGLDGTGRPGPAQREGYVVLAPHYAPPDESGRLDPRLAKPISTRRVVEATLADASHRFHIDADRVFLSGHGRGAELALDIAHARPDPYAGVVAVGVLAPASLTWLWQNGSDLPTYWVNGELDRGSRARNADVLMNMFKAGHDLTYVEYIGRGFESYIDEAENIFDWAALRRRPPTPEEFTRKVLRGADNELAWLTLPDMTDPPVRIAFGKPVPLTPTVEADVLRPGNKIYLKTNQRRLQLAITPDLIDWDRKLRVRRGSRTLFHDFVTPDPAAMLRDFRRRADRRRIVAAQIIID